MNCEDTKMGMQVDTMSWRRDLEVVSAELSVPAGSLFRLIDEAPFAAVATQKALQYMHELDYIGRKYQMREFVPIVMELVDAQPDQLCVSSSILSSHGVLIVPHSREQVTAMRDRVVKSKARQKLARRAQQSNVETRILEVGALALNKQFTLAEPNTPSSNYGERSQNDQAKVKRTWAELESLPLGLRRGLSSDSLGSSTLMLAAIDVLRSTVGDRTFDDLCCAIEERFGVVVEQDILAKHLQYILTENEQTSKYFTVQQQVVDAKTLYRFGWNRMRKFS